MRDHHFMGRRIINRTGSRVAQHRCERDSNLGTGFRSTNNGLIRRLELTCSRG